MPLRLPREGQVNIIPLGKLATEDAGRDAIHIAVAPVVAAQILSPGEHVGINGEGQAVSSMNGIGIVDPYLMRAVKPGERFYLCLYPNTITSLRHHWVHPAFKEEAPPTKAAFDKGESEAWLRDYAVNFKSYPDYCNDKEEAYQELLRDLREGHLCSVGSGMYGLSELPDSDELKRHAEIVLGITINWGNFTFSCSC